MNLVEIEPNLQEKILTRAESIAFFVFNGEYFWIIDWPEHFNLDHMKNIEALCSDDELMRYLPIGQSKAQYRDQVIRRYRDGIPCLTREMFPKYRDSESAKVVTTELLRDEFFQRGSGELSSLSRAMECELSFGVKMDDKLFQLRENLSAKLPKFYINYDRKIFMHMVGGRSYEAVVFDDWWGAQVDFEHMIPTSYRYWVRSMNEDFWAITNFIND